MRLPAACVQALSPKHRKRQPSSRSVRWPAVTRPSLRRSPNWMSSSIGWWHRPLRSCSPCQLLPAVGTDHAATLLIVAGDNPQRLRSEASFASLCGVSPVEASSGKVVRHRLNRGGNRDANRALHMICMVRMGMDGRTQQYVARRTAEGKSKREILRCLKRYVAREVYRVLVEAVEAPPLTTAYPTPTSKRISVMS